MAPAGHPAHAGHGDGPHAIGAGSGDRPRARAHQTVRLPGQRVPGRGRDGVLLPSGGLVDLEPDPPRAGVVLRRPRRPIVRRPAVLRARAHDAGEAARDARPPWRWPPPAARCCIGFSGCSASRREAYGPSRWPGVLALCVVLACAALNLNWTRLLAQTGADSPQFEVASVKPNKFEQRLCHSREPGRPVHRARRAAAAADSAGVSGAGFSDHRRARLARLRSLRHRGQSPVQRWRPIRHRAGAQPGLVDDPRAPRGTVQADRAQGDAGHAGLRARPGEERRQARPAPSPDDRRLRRARGCPSTRRQRVISGRSSRRRHRLRHERRPRRHPGWWPVDGATGDRFFEP